MRKPIKPALLVPIAAAAACVATGDVADRGTAAGAWVGTITTEGNVTTVVNEAGSVWGGTATLEEELSIGVDVGEPEYMFGRIRSVTADRAHIYVLESQPPVLRVFDFDGRHVRDIGRAGQGPGEFGYPSGVSVLPDGRVLVRDDDNSRMNVFTREGELLDTWSWSGGYGTSRATVIGVDGSVYRPAPVGRDPQTRRSSWGFFRHTLDGAVSETLHPPDFGYVAPRLEAGNASGSVPFYPNPIAELSPAGAWIAGVGDDYRFEIRYFDGRVTVVERIVDPVRVSDEELDWNTRRTTARWREEDPSWRWSGPGVRDTKPFFTSLSPDADGRIWVRTSLPSDRVAECTEAPQPGERVVPCWQRGFGIEVFDSDGRYLGDVRFPGGRFPSLSLTYIRDDMLLKVQEDDAGTVVVKRYRLVLPETAP